jgi:hypothetical protein
MFPPQLMKDAPRPTSDIHMTPPIVECVVLTGGTFN